MEPREVTIPDTKTRVQLPPGLDNPMTHLEGNATCSFTTDSQISCYPCFMGIWNPTGRRRLENHCFLNSVLQVLMSIPSFRLGIFINHHWPGGTCIAYLSCQSEGTMPLNDVYR